MAGGVDLICLVFMWSLWSTCDGATNTLKSGESLDSSRSLVSANGKFTLNFRVYEHDANLSYLVIKWNASHNYAWVANRETPILYPFGVLTLDRNYTLKITHRDGGAVVLYSADSKTISGDVVATLMDDGNFVLQEVSDAGSVKRDLWQSFDYPGDVLLPGMKLGVNRSNGHHWSLSCWLTEKSAVPGPFTLDWDPDGHELKIKRRGVVYWSSGVFRDGSFENIKQKRYNFSIVSKKNEDYFSYTTLDENAVSEWLLTTIGRLKDFDESIDIAKADSCYGYNTDSGCQIWDQPTKCGRFGDVFEQENGYFNPTDASGSTVSSRSDSNTSLSISDCKDACWADCNCRGFIFLFPNQTGCRYWTGNFKFIADSAGYSSSVVYFLTTKSDSSSYAAHKWIWIGAAIGTSVFLMAVCIICCLLRRRKLSLFGKNKAKIDEKDLLDLRGSDISTDVHGIQNDGSMGHDLRAFSYESIMAATDCFSLQNKLGEGGFGPVYKGKLSSGREVAIKRLSRGSVQGTLEFKNELILISELQHTNLVQLLGYCIHGVERMLIYEYLPNKSLDYILFDSTRGMLLDWKKRFNIIEGIAQGLIYLHKYSRLKVIHRDLKASNILLDEDMNPKISDFGMARIFTVNEVEANTNRIVGTYGYMSPEYAMEGIFSGKSDVFSFGVLMLEIISGRRNNSFHNAHRSLNLVGYTWELWKEGAGLDLMDPRLSDSCNRDQLLRCIHVGLLCVEEDAEHRPTMSDAISLLTNESLPLPTPTKPAFFPVRRVAEVDVSGSKSEISSNDLSNSFVIGR
ncbi:G-type lectin S-receptor-like serine/threonine-protein kinase CES101 isoform X1 [Rosa rugosa]|uniref:G-type lectin S-receptor-like serine/threonine-protein kinase CES101 isoform X1 n=1 Tax=Rosa rugosa TaxID=74645 RepID=UPI002B402C73|nr:G-type lectin S-receptor-like serine/threonine-protein kinase CES101 isoform X1 [Rosa rugosa]